MAAWIFRSLFRRSRNRPQTIQQLLKIPKQKRPSFRKNGMTVLLCLYFELEGRLFWFLFGTWGNTRVKIKRKERGLKLILMTGWPAGPKSAKNRARAHWKRGGLPRLGPALLLWRGIIAIMSRCTLAVGGLWPAAYVLPPTLAGHARRVKLQYCRCRSSTCGRSKTGRSSQPY